jgi:hypothetical protein
VLNKLALKNGQRSPLPSSPPLPPPSLDRRACIQIVDVSLLFLPCLSKPVELSGRRSHFTLPPFCKSRRFRLVSLLESDASAPSIATLRPPLGCLQTPLEPQSCQRSMRAPRIRNARGRVVRQKSTGVVGRSGEGKSFCVPLSAFSNARPPEHQSQTVAADSVRCCLLHRPTPEGCV